MSAPGAPPPPPPRGLPRDLDGRLADYVEGVAEAPFAWGLHDCCLFPCNLLYALLQWDPAEPLRGYETREEALQQLAAFAGEASLVAAVELIAGMAGCPEIPWRRAQRLDILLGEPPEDPKLAAAFDWQGFDGMLAICAGAEALFVTQGGLRSLRVERLARMMRLRCWGVTHA